MDELKHEEIIDFIKTYLKIRIDKHGSSLSVTLYIDNDTDNGIVVSYDSIPLSKIQG